MDSNSVKFLWGASSGNSKFKIYQEIVIKMMLQTPLIVLDEIFMAHSGWVESFLEAVSQFMPNAIIV